MLPLAPSGAQVQEARSPSRLIKEPQRSFSARIMAAKACGPSPTGCHHTFAISCWVS